MKPFLRYYSAKINRYAEELSYRGTVTNACVCVASAVNVLSGGKAFDNVYYDMINGDMDAPHDPVEEQRSAEEIKQRIMSRVNAMSEGKNGGLTL